MLKDILAHFKKNGTGKTKENAVTVPCRYWINTEKCRGCNKCKMICKAGAISGERGETYVIDEQKCLKCGTCKKWCRDGAIERLDMYSGQ